MCNDGVVQLGAGYLALHKKQTFLFLQGINESTTFWHDHFVAELFCTAYIVSTPFWLISFLSQTFSAPIWSF